MQRGYHCHIVELDGGLCRAVEAAIEENLIVVRHDELPIGVAAATNDNFAIGIVVVVSCARFDVADFEPQLRARALCPLLIACHGTPTRRAATVAYELGASFLAVEDLSPEQIRRFLIRSLVARHTIRSIVSGEVVRLLEDCGVTGVQARLVLGELGVLRFDATEYGMSGHGVDYHRREIRKKIGVPVTEIPKLLLDRLLHGR